MKPADEDRVLQEEVISEGGNGIEDIEIDPLLTIETDIPSL